MENPKQIIYSPEELFSLRPETGKSPSTGSKKCNYSDAQSLSNLIAITPSLPSRRFWKKYKWHMVTGLFLLGGISLAIIYKNYQKRNRDDKY